MLPPIHVVSSLSCFNIQNGSIMSMNYVSEAYADALQFMCDNIALRVASFATLCIDSLLSTCSDKGVCVRKKGDITFDDVDYYDSEDELLPFDDVENGYGGRYGASTSSDDDDYGFFVFI